MRTKVVTSKSNKFILRWFDEAANRWRERSTGLTSTEANRGKAYRMLAKLQDELSGDAPPALTAPPITNQEEFFDPKNSQALTLNGDWDGYVAYFEQNHLSALSKGYASVMMPIVTKFQRFSNVRYLQEINTPMIRRWVTSLQKENLSNATIHSYWGHLSSFLRVALEDGIIRAVPKIRLPKIDRTSMSKGRSLTGEEFDRMLAAVDEVRPVQAARWKYLLRGLWAGGLRIGEACRLTWDPSDFYVDLDRTYPVFIIDARGQKSRRAQTLPMAPEFAELLQETPRSRRSGFVFRPLAESGRSLAQGRVERTISEFGRSAKVRVGEKKTASAHDLRRTFGSRWALKVMPQVLQQMMRHADIQTTMRFYVDLKASDLGEVIYQANGAERGANHKKTDRESSVLGGE